MEVTQSEKWVSSRSKEKAAFENWIKLRVTEKRKIRRKVKQVAPRLRQCKRRGKERDVTLSEKEREQLREGSALQCFKIVTDRTLNEKQGKIKREVGQGTEGEKSILCANYFSGGAKIRRHIPAPYSGVKATHKNGAAVTGIFVGRSHYGPKQKKTQNQQPSNHSLSYKLGNEQIERVSK